MRVLGTTVVVALAATLIVVGAVRLARKRVPKTTATFRFRILLPAGSEFMATTSRPDVLVQVREELKTPLDKRRLFINGRIARGNGGNLDWSWHFVPDEWSLAEASIELCDGTPELVEADLDSWVVDVGRFCPWWSRVIEELR